jgi:hypothetical protein
MSTRPENTPSTVFNVEHPARPYPGLRPFQTNEWSIFFGRERMADEVLDRLIERQIVVVHGDSGCGKSSLVRAAILPRLKQENARGGIRWRTCIARPWCIDRHHRAADTAQAGNLALHQLPRVDRT